MSSKWKSANHIFMKKNETEILTPTHCPKTLANRLVALFCVNFLQNQQNALQVRLFIHSKYSLIMNFDIITVLFEKLATVGRIGI